MSDYTPASERSFPEVVVRIVEHNRGVPESGIRINLTHRNRATKGLDDTLDQLVDEGRLVERNGKYWTPEDAPDDV
ncbi:hypothetical protein [Halorubrum aethiopicum]|uniref:hypothetical protein n=1 Tax=Halorubrum aethiopicum TaxID=1758255 RepID=UPI00082E0681|nr:hypothetical protein [Halorubrum aethiopicum]